MMKEDDTVINSLVVCRCSLVRFLILFFLKTVFSLAFAVRFILKIITMFPITTIIILLGIYQIFSKVQKVLEVYIYISTTFTT